MCKQPKDNKKSKNKKDAKKSVNTKDKSRKVEDDSSADNMDDADSELTAEVGGVREMVGHSVQPGLLEPQVSLMFRSREGDKYLKVRWMPDSGVYHMLITKKKCIKSY